MASKQSIEHLIRTKLRARFSTTQGAGRLVARWRLATLTKPDYRKYELHRREYWDDFTP